MPRRSMINTDSVAEQKTTEIDLNSNIPESQVYDTLQELNFAAVTNETMQSQNVQKYAKDLAFMEQQVTFVVQPGSKEDAHTLKLGVNGQNVDVVRGQPIRAARKFLNTLFSFTHEVETQQYIDPATGLTQTRLLKKQQPAYPVSLLDDTQEGRNWFASNQRSYYIG